MTDARPAYDSTGSRWRLIGRAKCAVVAAVASVVVEAGLGRWRGRGRAAAMKEMPVATSVAWSRKQAMANCILMGRARRQLGGSG